MSESEFKNILTTHVRGYLDLESQLTTIKNKIHLLEKEQKEIEDVLRNEKAKTANHIYNYASSGRFHFGLDGKIVRIEVEAPNLARVYPACKVEVYEILDLSSYGL